MSKGLEALEKLGEMTLESEYGDEPKVKGLVLYEIIEKELKVLEIIKYKGLDVGVLQGCFERNETVKEYLRYSDDDCNCEEEQLTQEEYDLLKEVLL